MIVANFKANGNSSFILKWHEEFIQAASESIFSSVGVAPSHIHFYKLNKLFKETSVRLGMQNIDEEGGARTGSISAEMASEIGCSFLILGHSERRIFYNENNNNIKNKIQISIKHDITPILCIGETLEENESGKTKDVLKNQLNDSLHNIEIYKRCCTIRICK
jgi:triosephosphate isomerase